MHDADHLSTVFVLNNELYHEYDPRSDGGDQWQTSTEMAAAATAAVQIGLAVGQAAGGVLGVLFHSKTRDDATGRVRRKIVVRHGRVFEEVSGEEGPWGESTTIQVCQVSHMFGVCMWGNKKTFGDG
jgi:hypothetical protein